MNFGESISVCFSKYFDFSGRARRSEYWWFYLFCSVGSFIPYIGIIVALATIIPSFAAGARRLHDIDRTGWWQSMPMVPFIIGSLFILMAFVANQNNPNPVLLVIGGINVIAGLVTLIVLIVWLATDTYPGPNRFGPAPK